MKILKLQFENINSLAGRWSIDFTGAAFNEGLFTISGPTGAGKTSILDALCLALYGQTDRQNIVSKAKNEVMTRGCLSCSAEAEFEARGRRYRAFWEHRRTKTGSKDEFAAPQRRVYRFDEEAADWVPLAHKIEEADGEIKKILKMDFKQFTTAVFLPQGKFAAFIEAAPRERAGILEKITGAEIYSQIGAAVQTRMKNERTALEHLELKAAEIIVLTPEESEYIKNEIIKNKADVLQKYRDIAVLDEQIKQYEAAAKLIHEQSMLHSRLSALTAEQTAAAGEFADVEKAHVAREIAPIAENCEHAQKRRTETQAQVCETQKALGEALEAENACLENLARSQNELSSAVEALERAMPNIILARELTVELKNSAQILREKQAKLAESEKNYIHWQNIYKTACSEKEKLAAAEKEASENLNVCKKLIQEMREMRDSHGMEIEALTVFAKTADYGTARESLLDGQPCPLCGAVDHPFCEGLSAVQENESRYKELFALRKTAEAALKKAEKEVDAVDALKAARAAAGIELESRIAAGQARCTSEKDAAALLTAEIAPLQTAADDIQSRFSAALALLPPEAHTSLALCETALAEARDAAAARLLQAQQTAGLWKGKKEAHTAELAKKQAVAEAAAAEWTEAQNSADAAFERQGFESYAHWKMYNWDIQKTRQIEEKKIRLEADISNVKRQAAAIDGELESLHSTGENAAAENCIQSKERLQSEIEELTAAAGGMEQRLAEDARQCERLELRAKEIAEQKKIYIRWKAMDDWIGGKDGYRFKEYVQAITFKNLVYNANKYLLDMTSGRYQMLTKKENTDLLPIVIDIHQGSIERNISNLSGGERFIMSLSLALGLSSLTSEGLRIDSIFLDEGFGSLDRLSLDTIINTLCRLHESSNKLIGIISHVEELKQRISCSIEVERLGAGRSRLKGAGITTSS